MQRTPLIAQRCTACKREDCLFFRGETYIQCMLTGRAAMSSSYGCTKKRNMNIVINVDSFRRTRKRVAGSNNLASFILGDEGGTRLLMSEWGPPPPPVHPCTQYRSTQPCVKRNKRMGAEGGLFSSLTFFRLGGESRNQLWYSTANTWASFSADSMGCDFARCAISCVHGWYIVYK